MPNFAELFGAPTWPQVEQGIHAALTEAGHPHADDLRRLLREHGCAAPGAQRGSSNLADLLREAEDRYARMQREDAEERERGRHA